MLGAGAGAGFASGLLGVGGGFVTIPVTCWVVAAMGIPSTIATRIAFGTGLLAMLPTVVSGAWRHNKIKAVRWKATLVLGLCGLAGGLSGASLAAHLSGKTLQVGFGVLVLAVALWMGLGIPLKLGKEAAEPRNNFWPLAVYGFPIGIISGLTGLGGGMLIVPVLVLVLHFPVHIAIGTSVASIMFTSLGGVIGYVVNGLGVSGALPYSIGYINLPIGLCLVATSIPMAQLGSRTAHALPAKQLRYVFIAVMAYAGLKMLGVF